MVFMNEFARKRYVDYTKPIFNKKLSHGLVSLRSNMLPRKMKAANRSKKDLH
jgi:hypothetical protein